MNGVLVLDKPSGLTSARAVAKVKGRLGARKAGHAGTLDPLATGVLPILLGEGTKLARLFLEGDKEYRFTLHLGVTTDTADADGEVVAEADPSAVTATRLEEVVAGLRGPGEQIPPMYSAVQQGGVRLYKLARAGKEVAREPRSIIVHRLVVTELELPYATLALACSKGTYVRELGSEIGRQLGCGAHTAKLRRTRSGPFSEAQSAQLDDLDPATAPLVSLADASAHLPTLTLDAALARRVRLGHQPGGLDVWPTLTDRLAAGTVVRLLGPGEDLVASAEVRVPLDPEESPPPREALKLLRVFAE